MSSKQNENKPLQKNSSSKNPFESVSYLHNKYQDTLQIIIDNTNASLLLLLLLLLCLSGFYLTLWCHPSTHLCLPYAGHWFETVQVLYSIYFSPFLGTIFSIHTIYHNYYNLQRLLLYCCLQHFLYFLKETAVNKTVTSGQFTSVTTGAALYIWLGIFKKAVHKNDKIHKWKNMYKYT